jgi:C1A family cysteine protease
MALVGWNDAQSAFLLYNSHGTTWGTNGVGLLSYEGWANGLGTYTWTVEP